MNYGKYFDAANPARVQLDLFHFLKCDLQSSFLYAGVALAGAGVCFFQLVAGIVICAIAGIAWGMALVEAKRVFQRGEICAAQIVDAKSNLIAAFTDLSRGSRPVPALKVVRQPLRRALGGSLRDGTRLAYVALPNGFPGRSRWENFGGYLVNSGTTNSTVIRRVVASISAEDWDLLERGVAGLYGSFQKGLYTNLDFKSAPVTSKMQSAPADVVTRSKVVCPNCEVRLRPRNAIVAGQRVVCPKCKQPFVASVLETDDFWSPDESRERSEGPVLTRSPRARRSGVRWLARGPLTGPAYIALVILLAGSQIWVRWGRISALLHPQKAAGSLKPNPLTDGPSVAMSDPNFASPDSISPDSTLSEAAAPPARAGSEPSPEPKDSRVEPSPPHSTFDAGARQRLSPGAGRPTDEARKHFESAQERRARLQPSSSWPTSTKRIVISNGVREKFIRESGPQNVIFVIVPDRTLWIAEQQAVAKDIRAIIGNGPWAVQADLNLPDTELLFRSNQDIADVAAKITITKVRSVDVANRRIILEPWTPKIDNPFLKPALPPATTAPATRRPYRGGSGI
jgi:hypothetical protein